MAFRDGQQLTNPKFPGEFRYFYKGNALTEDEFTRASGAPPPLGEGAQSGGVGGMAPLPQTSRQNALMSTPDYRKRAAQGLAGLDTKAQEAIGAGLQEASSADTQLGILQDQVRQAPTGSFAGVRKTLGKNVGDALGGLPFIPTREEAQSLENLGTLTAERTLGDVSKLKGPLSDKDVRFLASMQVDPYASRGHNQFVVDLQKWANNRRSNYYNGMQAWTNVLGSPRATNGNGLTYDQWWAKWSEANIPRPSGTVPTRREQQNAALKAKSAGARSAPGGAIKVLEVYN